MRKLAKAGLVLVTIGAAAYGLPVLRYDYPTHVPLRAPFRIETGAVFRHDFTVRTSENYGLTIGCRDVAPLNYSLSDFVGGGSNSPRIPCDIALRLLRGGEVIQSEHLDVLRPAHFCNGTSYWHLAYVHLPSAGRYTLEITNRSDLGSLAPTEPVVDMDVGGFFYENAIFSKLFGLIIGAPVVLLGMALFFCGLRRGAGAEPNAPPNGGPGELLGNSGVVDGPPSVS
jgi:hypothetical protein